MKWIKDQLVNRDPKYVHNSNIINKLELLVNIYLIHSFKDSGVTCIGAEQTMNTMGLGCATLK